MLPAPDVVVEHRQDPRNAPPRRRRPHRGDGCRGRCGLRGDRRDLGGHQWCDRCQPGRPPAPEDDLGPLCAAKTGAESITMDARRIFLENWPLKLASLVLAVTLW